MSDKREFELDELGGGLLPAIYLRYFHTRDEARAELTEACIELPLAEGSPAQTAFLEAEDGRPAAIVVVEPERYDAATVGLIAHEATHVVSQYLRWLGETDPGDEMLAYLIQSVTSYLIEHHTDMYVTNVVGGIGDD